jgi:zinc protease
MGSDHEGRRSRHHATFAKEGLASIVELEADRFQNLDYAENLFRTEALAVNGEYNKNSAQPYSKLSEVARDTAFDAHTYKHTTMGFLADIKAMPDQYAYSKQFFDRFYRPEYTTVLVVGEVKPAEAPQKAERKGHVDWPTPTAPWLMVGYKIPAYADDDKDSAALTLIGSLAFGQTSPAYQRLVLQEQKVDFIFGDGPPHVDPYLFTVVSRIKKDADVEPVRETIVSTLNGLKDTLVDVKRLDALKKNVRYGFAMSMNNSEAIADALARAIALRRTPETLNRRYAMFDQITPEDIRAAARKYFVETGRTVVTLTGPKAK